MKLSRREKELLDILVEVDTCSTAALKLGITDATVYNMLYRIRKKQQQARTFINMLLSYRRRSKLLNKVLRRRVTVEEEKTLIEKL